MSSLDNLRTRLTYQGGIAQEDRMDQDKLRSLKKALLYSYQAQTAILDDDREFKCLINHDKLKEDYDDKIISIPYEDVCLNGGDEKFIDWDPEDLRKINMKVGDTFTWKETNTHWIVIQEILEENAYFRGTIRKAQDEVVIDGKSYYGWFSRDNDEALWHTKGKTSWSEMGYEVVLYITADDTTRGYFSRFQKVTIKDRLWEVQMVDDITSDTMLIIFLRETFTNEFEDAEAGEESQDEVTPSPDETDPTPTEAAAIIGKDSLYPFDTSVYTVENALDGTWFLSNSKAKIDGVSPTSVTITIVTSKSGSVDLIYKRDGEEDIIKTITINSL